MQLSCVTHGPLNGGTQTVAQKRDITALARIGQRCESDASGKSQFEQWIEVSAIIRKEPGVARGQCWVRGCRLEPLDEITRNGIDLTLSGGRNFVTHFEQGSQATAAN